MKKLISFLKNLFTKHEPNLDLSDAELKAHQERLKRITNFKPNFPNSTYQ